MKYPMAADCLHYEKIAQKQYRVTDYMTENEYIFGEGIVNFIQHLDGKTDPKKIDASLSEEDVEIILRDLDEYGLLRHSRVFMQQKGTRYITLCVFKWTPFRKTVARIYYQIVQWLWLPFFLCGLIVGRTVPHQYGSFWPFFLLIWGSVISIIPFHEFAHVAAGITYGTDVYEIGMIFWYIFPRGAYTVINNRYVKKVSNRVRIDTAGIKANFFFGGLFFLLAYVSIGSLINILYYAAFSFIALGILNLLAVGGLDGCHILITAFDDAQLVRRAKTVLKRKSLRRKQWKRGLPGVITLAACCYFYIQPVVLAAIYILYLWVYA